MIDIGINIINKQFRNDVRSTIERAVNANVSNMILTGTSIENSQKAIGLSGQNPGVLYSTVGIHPHNAKTIDDQTKGKLADLLDKPNVVAVGECGLDFDRDFSPRPMQEKCFKLHLELALETQKPLFLHERAAFTRFNDIITNYSGKISNAVVHCFTGSLKEVKVYLDQGFYIGFTGAISDARRFNHLKEVVNYVPLDRLMIETDSPFMLPKNIDSKLLNPKNKRRNEPAFLPFVAESIAQFKKVSVGDVIAETTENAKSFFGI